jgi:hypothetical protein
MYDIKMEQDVTHRDYIQYTRELMYIIAGILAMGSLV